MKLSKFLSLSLSSLLLIPLFIAPVWSAESDLYRLKEDEKYSFAENSDSLAHRQGVYLAERKEAAPAALKNLVPFGFGSYSQGDIVGGAALTVLDTISTAVLISAFFQDNDWGLALLGVYGLTGLGLGRVAGVFLPYMYTAGYNKELRNRLNLSEEQIQNLMHGSHLGQEPILSLATYQLRF